MTHVSFGCRNLPGLYHHDHPLVPGKPWCPFVRHFQNEVNGLFGIDLGRRYWQAVEIGGVRPEAYLAGIGASFFVLEP